MPKINISKVESELLSMLINDFIKNGPNLKDEIQDKGIRKLKSIELKLAETCIFPNIVLPAKTKRKLYDLSVKEFSENKGFKYSVIESLNYKLLYRSYKRIYISLNDHLIFEEDMYKVIEIVWDYDTSHCIITVELLKD